MNKYVKKFLLSLSDENYLRLLYFYRMHKVLRLKKPRTFNEKIQWLKLYDRDPLYTRMVDKYTAKEYVSNIIGTEYIIPTYGVWNTFDDIDFNSLPNSFVLKCTHDSGGVIVCHDKDSLNLSKVKMMMNKAYSLNPYITLKEWPYKNVVPRIIVEKVLADDSTKSIKEQSLSDYKFYCFNGEIDCVMVCYDRGSGDTKYYFFDKEWKLKRINKRGKKAPPEFTLPKPQCFEKMLDVASVLSKGIPFVRVDLYQSDGHVYFGELTFYPQSGFDLNYLPETDYYFGSLIDLSNAYIYKSKSGDALTC